jgi:hypothetical protein
MKTGKNVYEKVKAELARLENPTSAAKPLQAEEAIRQMKQLERRVRQVLAGRPKR